MKKRLPALLCIIIFILILIMSYANGKAIDECMSHGNTEDYCFKALKP